MNGILKTYQAYTLYSIRVYSGDLWN